MSKTQRLVVVVFVGLLLLCTTIMIASNFLGPVAEDAILPIATDGFKTILGALVGSISTLLGQKNATRS